MMLISTYTVMIKNVLYDGYIALIENIGQNPILSVHERQERQTFVLIENNIHINLGQAYNWSQRNNDTISLNYSTIIIS